MATTKKYGRITLYFDPENTVHMAMYNRILEATKNSRKQRTQYIIEQLQIAEQYSNQQELSKDKMVDDIIAGITPLLSNLSVQAQPAEAAVEADADLLADMNSFFG